MIRRWWFILLLLGSSLPYHAMADNEVSLISAMSRTYSFRHASGQEATFEIKVANLSPTKSVAIHYQALDGTWKDVEANYVGVTGDEKELWRASFHLCTAVNSFQCPEVTATDLKFAIRLRANGQEYWDNNSGANYYIGKDDGYLLSSAYHLMVHRKGEFHCSTADATCQLSGGQILLQNFAPLKTVTVVYTTDEWQTSAEQQAEFYDTTYTHPLGRFTNPGVQGGELWWFTLEGIPRGATNLKYFVKYNFGAGDSIDNNFAQNYRLAIPDFPTVYVRGTHNNWRAEYPNMTKITRFNGDVYWQGTFDFTGHAILERFKFDIDAINNPWSWSYGDFDNDGRNWSGIADRDGFDIKILGGPGMYEITLEDDSHAYQVRKLDDMQTPQAARTVVFIGAEIDEDETALLRGGIDWTYSLIERFTDCSVTEEAKWNCAIPMHHRILPLDPARAYDWYLDWHGAEEFQGDVQGTPLVWTTSDSGHETNVLEDGEGFTPFNQWGENYWMLDATMDCTHAPQDSEGNRWFELKLFIANGDGWEEDIDQYGAPYQSNNHFAQCGKINVYNRGADDALIFDIN